MCGIAGFIDFRNKSDEEELKRMTDSISHRGPDSAGYKFVQEEKFQVGLGHRRLSIIDLSPLGGQPMEFNNYTIIFNGEVYNYNEIRKELISEGYQFDSNSDTEVVLKSFDKWGIDAVHKFNGMFAFVIYDKGDHCIYVFRDRTGIKPFYFYFAEDLFLFSSELKAFHKHHLFEKKIDLEALALYLKYGYIVAPYCIFENCYKLQPGHLLTLNLSSKKYKIDKYWDVVDYYNKPKHDISYEDAILETEELLKSSCEYRMIADVPVGVFLSGGYDSSTVAALIQANRKDPIETFTIGFENPKYDESNQAKKIANHIGTSHNELICTLKEVQSIVPKLPLYFDEPFGDSSSIPTILVSQFAKEKVKVSLSADGGDEVFAGYTRYKNVLSNYKKYNYFSENVTKKIGQIIQKSPLNSFKSIMDNPQLVDKIIKLSNSFTEGFSPGSLLKHSSQRVDQNFIDRLIGTRLPTNTSAFDKYKDLVNGSKNELDQLLVMDYCTYLPDDIMTKVDRSTMSVSLEGREPLLDYRLIEFVAQLPDEYKILGTQQKRILKDITHKYIPKTIMDSPKKGFGIPLNDWFREELKDLFEYYLGEKFIKEQGLFEYKLLYKLKEQFYSGINEQFEFLWFIISFQLWYQKWIIDEKN